MIEISLRVRRGSDKRKLGRRPWPAWTVANESAIETPSGSVFTWIDNPPQPSLFSEVSLLRIQVACYAGATKAAIFCGQVSTSCHLSRHLLTTSRHGIDHNLEAHHDHRACDA
jgi:hypothetical protein